jgi:hypothetical protein
MSRASTASLIARPSYSGSRPPHGCRGRSSTQREKDARCPAGGRCIDRAAREDPRVRRTPGPMTISRSVSKADRRRAEIEAVEKAQRPTGAAAHASVTRPVTLSHAQIVAEGKRVPMLNVNEAGRRAYYRACRQAPAGVGSARGGRVRAPISALGRRRRGAYRRSCAPAATSTVTSSGVAVVVPPP